MSKESDSFVNSLKAAFPYMSKEAVSLYQSKLEKWRLTHGQWVNALDTLVAVETDGNPPQLSAIYSELQRQQEAVAEKHSMGWQYFTLENSDYATRVRRADGIWVIANGWPHAGDPATAYIPSGATNYRLIPDQIYIPPDEIVDAKQVREIIEQSQRAILKRAAAKALEAS